MYRIRLFEPDEDGETLYWNNEDGWGSIESADEFDQMEWNLPIGDCEWEYFDERISE